MYLHDWGEIELNVGRMGCWPCSAGLEVSGLEFYTINMRTYKLSGDFSVMIIFGAILCAQLVCGNDWTRCTYIDSVLSLHIPAMNTPSMLFGLSLLVYRTNHMLVQSTISVVPNLGIFSSPQQRKRNLAAPTEPSARGLSHLAGAINQLLPMGCNYAQHRA